MGKINADWHNKNRMPKKPSHEERLAWHTAHTTNCSCRKMPEDLRKELITAGRMPLPEKI